MSRSQTLTASPRKPAEPGSLIVGTGLAFASLILVPALATSIGLGPSLTGALRMALMKASNRAVNGTSLNVKAPAMSTRSPRVYSAR